jgi:hypothetical protein
VASFAENSPRTFSTASPSIKHKNIDFIDTPHFCHGYVWSDGLDNNISPAAHYTEFAPPLPSPPQHLLDDETL